MSYGWQKIIVLGDVVGLLLTGTAAAIFYGDSLWVIPWWVFLATAAMTFGSLTRHARLVPDLFDKDES